MKKKVNYSKEYRKGHLDDFEKIKESKNPEEIISFIDSLGNRYVSSETLFKKAITMLLYGEKEYEYPIEDIQELFEIIKRYDPSCLEAHLELSHYYDSMLDKPRAALKMTDEISQRIEDVYAQLKKLKKDILSTP